MGRLDRKVAIITGVGNAAGRGSALALADEGALIALLGRTLATLEEVCAEIHRRGGEAAAFICDVTDPEDIEGAVQDVVDEFGSIDILVNSAQARVLGELNALTEDEFLLGLDTGPLAVFRMMRECYPYLRRDGAIVNIASTLALDNNSAGLGGFLAAKEAIRALSRSAAREWAVDGIRVNCVLVPLEGDDEDESVLPETDNFAADIGRAVVFLCGPDGRLITGHSLPLDGGLLR